MKTTHLQKGLFATAITFFFQLANAQTLLKEIRTGQDGANIFQQTLTKGNQLYFLAEDDALRNSIWKTDGSVGGTTAVVSLDKFYTYALLGFKGNDLLFIGGYLTGDTIGAALYKVNTQTTTWSLVKDINTVDNDFIYFGGGSAQFDNGDIFFFANDGVTGFEPWITDGTNAGTRLVKDINPTTNSILGTSPLKYFAKLNNVLYFGAGRDTDGAELWKSDGTAAGTVLVKDIETDNSFGTYQLGSNPAFFTVYNNKVYFSANTLTYGRELWVTDGTTAGTQMVVDFTTGNASPEELTVYNGYLYYRGYTNNDGFCLIKSNGTAAGTSIVKTATAGGLENPEDIVLFKNKLYMSGADNNGSYGIFSTDGSTFTKSAVADRAFHLLATSNYIYYKAFDSNSLLNLFSTDGGATQTKLNSSTTIEIDDQKPLYIINSCLLFSADNGTSGQELFSICNQQSQPLAIQDKWKFSDVDVAVYPNPSTGQFTIESESVGIEKLSLFSIDGRVVYDNTAIQISGSINISLADNLPTGMYVLMILTKEGYTLKKNISIVK